MPSFPSFRAMLLLAAFTCWVAVAARAQSADLIVQTDKGQIQGYSSATGTHGSTVYIWKNIPFAKPPVDELRFAPPIANDAWTGVRDGANFSNCCFQIPKSSPLPYGTESEDCLYLNVWAPKKPSDRNQEKLPVMVWIYGGSFTSGSGSFFLYDGSKLASEGALVVTLNYRLGILGFSAWDSPSANLGLKDQQLAMAWVQNNIGMFGGDKDRVTIFGESAGSISISLHLVIPSSFPLYRRAAMESGTAFQGGIDGPQRVYSYNITNAQLQTLAAVQMVNASCADIACARTLPAKSLIAITGNPLFNSWGPVVDGQFVTDDPLRLLQHAKNNPDADIMIGDVLNEGTSFVPLNITDAAYRARIVADYGTSLAEEIYNQYPSSKFSSPGYAFARALTDYFFTCPSLRLLRIVDAQSSAVDRPTTTAGTATVAAAKPRSLYNWLFTHVPSWITCPGPFCYEVPYGVAHTYEMFFVWGNNVPLVPFTAGEAALSDAMRTYWVQFAASGNVLPENWPQYTNENFAYINFNTTFPLPIENAYDQSNCELWWALNP